MDLAQKSASHIEESQLLRAPPSTEIRLSYLRAISHMGNRRHASFKSLTDQFIVFECLFFA